MNKEEQYRKFSNTVKSVKGYLNLISENKIDKIAEELVNVSDIKYLFKQYGKKRKELKIRRDKQIDIYINKEGTIKIVQPLRHKIYNLTYNDKARSYLGVLLEIGDTKEIIEISGNSLIFMNNHLIKGIVDNKGFYNVHRGLEENCFGNMNEGFEATIKNEGIEVAVRKTIEDSYLLNIDSPYMESSYYPDFVSYFYANMDCNEPPLILENIEDNIYRYISLQRKKKTIELEELDKLLKIINKIEEKSDKVHSYHPSCWCKYCTSIKMSPIDKAQIITDDYSRVIVTEEQFKQILQEEGMKEKTINYLIDDLSDRMSEEKKREKRLLNYQKMESKLDCIKEGGSNEADCYDYISEDLDDIIEDLEERGIVDTEAYEEDYNLFVTTEEDIEEVEATLYDLKKKLEALKEEKNKLEKQTDYSNERYEQIILELEETTHQIEEKEAELRELDDLRDELGDVLEDYPDLTIIVNRYNNGTYDSYDLEMLLDIIVSDYSEYCPDCPTSSFKIVDIPMEWKMSEEEYIRGLVKDYTYIPNEEGTLKLERLFSATKEIMEYYTTQNNFIDINLLRLMSVSVVGLGTVGSNMAFLMSKIGFRFFNLIDYDYVVRHNLSNQFYVANTLGVYKTTALAWSLNNHLPVTKLNYFYHTVPLKFEHMIEFATDYLTRSTDNYIYTEDELKSAASYLIFRYSDIIITAVDNFETRANIIKEARDNYLIYGNDSIIVDIRLNSLTDYVLYIYRISESEKYEQHLRTLQDKDGNTLIPEQANTCGLTSSIIVAYQSTAKALELIIKLLRGEEVPFFNTNIF